MKRWEKTKDIFGKKVVDEIEIFRVDVKFESNNYL